MIAAQIRGDVMIGRIVIAALLASAVGVAFSAAPRDQPPTARVASLNSIPTGMSATPAMVRRVEVQPASRSVTPLQEEKPGGALPVPQLPATVAAQPAALLSIAPAAVAKPASNSVLRAGWQPELPGAPPTKPIARKLKRIVPPTAKFGPAARPPARSELGALLTRASRARHCAGNCPDFQNLTIC